MDLIINVILILIVIILIYEINPNIYNDTVSYINNDTMSHINNNFMSYINKFSNFKSLPDGLSPNLNSNFKTELIKSDIPKNDSKNDSKNNSNNITMSELALTTSDILNETRNPFILDTDNETYGKLNRKKNRTYNRFKKIDYDKLLGQEMTHIPWWGRNDE